MAPIAGRERGCASAGQAGKRRSPFRSIGGASSKTRAATALFPKLLKMPMRAAQMNAASGANKKTGPRTTSPQIATAPSTCQGAFQRRKGAPCVCAPRRRACPLTDATRKHNRDCTCQPAPGDRNQAPGRRTSNTRVYASISSFPSPMMSLCSIKYLSTRIAWENSVWSQSEQRAVFQVSVSALLISRNPPIDGTKPVGTPSGLRATGSPFPCPLPLNAFQGGMPECSP
jgi:hypothetical protein